MALFVGFAPIFILCLLFKKTAPLFQKWLYYGLATIFSGVMLGVMTEISMDLVGNLFGGATAGDFVAKVIGGGSQTAIMETVTQQLGLGVILSALLITVPPMAGMWFNGLMSSAYYGTNYFSGWNGMSGRTLGSGAGSGAHQQANYNVQNRTGDSNNQQPSNNHHATWTGGGSSTPNQPTDNTKPAGQADKGVAVKLLQEYYPLPVLQKDKDSDQTKGK